MQAVILTCFEVEASVESAKVLHAQTLERYGIECEYLPAVYKTAIDELEYIITDEKRFGGPEKNKCQDVAAEIATWHSHEKAWKRCIELNENLIVFEDDGLWHSHPPIEVLEDFNGDILNLSWPVWGHPKGIQKYILRHDGLQQREWCNNWHNMYDDLDTCSCNSLWLYGAQGYVVTPRGAQKLIDGKTMGILPADVYIGRNLVEIWDYFPLPVIQDQNRKKSLIRK